MGFWSFIFTTCCTSLFFGCLFFTKTFGGSHKGEMATHTFDLATYDRYIGLS